MTTIPAEAIQPLRERLTFLRTELQRCNDLEVGAIGDAPLIERAIQETEALIKRLETSNAPRHP